MLINNLFIYLFIYLLFVQDENQDKGPGKSINRLPLIVVTGNRTILSFNACKLVQYIVADILNEVLHGQQALLPIR